MTDDTDWLPDFSIVDDPAMADAVRVAYIRSRGGSKRLEWGDVKDEISTGEWGRLIAAGILEPVDDMFELADPDAIEDIDAVWEPIERDVDDSDDEDEWGGPEPETDPEPDLDDLYNDLL